MFDFLGVFLIVILLGLFAFLTIKAWKARRALIKWPLGILTSLLTLVFAAALVFSLMGFYQINFPRAQHPVTIINISTTPEMVSRGEKLASICIGCHSSTGKLPLDGGPNFIAGGPPLGVVAPPNLTPAGPLQNWSDGEIIRAIREGIHQDGRSLLIMPSMAFHSMSDKDVQSLVAYLRSQPSVQHATPNNQLNVLGAIMLGAKLIPPEALSQQAPITQPVVAPNPGSPDYGNYLISITGCHDCHGPNLSGGAGGTGGSAPNLTVLVPTWTEEQFVQTIRTGIDPSGHTLNPDQMPWKDISGAYSDAELGDIYSFLHGLTPITISSSTK